MSLWPGKKGHLLEFTWQQWEVIDVHAVIQGLTNLMLKLCFNSMKILNTNPVSRKSISVL